MRGNTRKNRVVILSEDGAQKPRSCQLNSLGVTDLRYMTARRRSRTWLADEHSVLITVEGRIGGFGDPIRFLSLDGGRRRAQIPSMVIPTPISKPLLVRTVRAGWTQHIENILQSSQADEGSRSAGSQRENVDRLIRVKHRSTRTLV
jgi:hypothetical protein